MYRRRGLKIDPSAFEILPEASRPREQVENPQGSKKTSMIFISTYINKDKK
jgi:hypothetical protein